MLPNIKITPNVSNTNSVIGSRAYTFLDSYIYMKNQRYNALYEKNKEILAIENNALLLKSPSILYNAFLQQSRILDSIIIRVRNFSLRIKPDIFENINYLIPSKNTLNDFLDAIQTVPNIPRMKYVNYDIKPIKYENMASFINLYKMEIKYYTDINTQTANKDKPFVKDKAAKYLIDTAMNHANVSTELLEMENIRIINNAKLHSIYEFFSHKGKFLSTLQKDFKTFQFYLRQYMAVQDIVKLMNPIELNNGDVMIGNNSNPITFNDYFVLYKHFSDMIKYMIKIISYHEQQYFNKIYALQGNIESYVSIINEVLDYRDKYDFNKSIDDNSLNESASCNYNSYDECERIARELGYRVTSIIEYNCYQMDTSKRPITEEMFNSIGYKKKPVRTSHYTEYTRDVDGGYFYVSDYNPNSGWHMFNLKFVKGTNPENIDMDKLIDNYFDNVNGKDSINESIETFLTNPTLSKNVAIYHGSAHKIENNRIRPISKNFGTKLSNPRFSSFWTIKPKEAEYMAIMNLLCGFLKVKCFFDVPFNDNSNMYVSEKDYGKIKKSDMCVYVYQKSIDKKWLRKGHDSSIDEFTLDIPISADSFTTINKNEILNKISFIADDKFNDGLKKFRDTVMHNKLFQDGHINIKSLLYKSRDTIDKYNSEMRHLNETYEDTYDLINGNQQSKAMLTDNAGVKDVFTRGDFSQYRKEDISENMEDIIPEPDTIEDIRDEVISNFNEYEGIPEEGDTICTLKNSLNI